MARRRARRAPAPAPGPAIARRPAVVGFVLGVLAAAAAVWWYVAIPLGIIAVALGWRAAQAARGRDARSIGLGIGALVTGVCGVLLGLAVALLSGCGDDGGTSSGDPPALADVGTKLEWSTDLDGLRCSGTITNHASRATGYLLKLEWVSENTKLADATTVIQPVQPGASSTFEVTSAAKGTASTTCRVAEIERT